MSSGPSASADRADDVVTAVLTASRVLIGVSARSLAQVEDSLTLSQFRTLVVLGDGGGNLNRLAEALGVTASSALRTMDRLVAAGLATRRENPENRREVLLGLTDEGARVVQEVTERRRDEIARILERMPVRRRRELVDAFQAFAVSAGEPAHHRATSLVW